MHVVFTIHDRPQYLAPVLDSWANVRNLNNTVMTFFIEPTETTDEQVELIDLFSEKVDAEVTVKVNDRKMGVLENPYHALSFSFREFGSLYTVLAEEDVLVSSDVLEYHEWASRKYLAEDMLLGVCSFSTADGPESDVYRAADFSPLIWGTWFNRWTESIGPTWDHDYSTGENGKQAGWDWNLRLRVMGDRKFLFPKASRSTHIGLHGVHMTPEHFDTAVAPGFRPDREPTNYTEVEHDPAMAD